MYGNDRVVYLTASSAAVPSTANISNFICLGQEISFEAPIYSFVKEKESNIDEETIHKLASYYKSTLKSLSE